MLYKTDACRQRYTNAANLLDDLANIGRRKRLTMTGDVSIIEGRTHPLCPGFLEHSRKVETEDSQRGMEK